MLLTKGSVAWLTSPLRTVLFPKCIHGHLAAVSAKCSSSLANRDGRRKILFTCEGQSKIRLMAGGSLLHGFYWTALAVYNQQNPIVIPENSDTYLEWLSSPFWANLGFALSGSFIYFVNVFAKKYVHEISMVPGTRMLDCHCHTFFGGKGPVRHIPVGSAEVVAESGAYLPFKPKGDDTFLLLDVRRGRFRDRPALLALLGAGGRPEDDPAAAPYLRLSSSCPPGEERRGTSSSSSASSSRSSPGEAAARRRGRHGRGR